MNKLEKDLLFYSNYCLHSSNLINNISKTNLNDRIFYICIDDKKIKVPQFITRVPSIFLVNEKKVLVEDEIDYWIRSKLKPVTQEPPAMPNYNPQMNQHPNNSPAQQTNYNPHLSPGGNNIPMPPPNYNQQMGQGQNNNQMPMPNYNPQMGQNSNNQMPPSNMSTSQMLNQEMANRQMTSLDSMPSPNGPSVQNKKGEPITQPTGEPGDIMAYHSNEMGSSMSGKYSFIEDEGNSSLNYNFSFLGDADTNSSRINTPKEFNKNGESDRKTKSQSDYERLLEQRNADSFSKGVQRI